MTASGTDPTADDRDRDRGRSARSPEPPRPLLTLRDGLPPVVETDAALAEVCAAIAAGTGPVAIDAERASGYRYSTRAYLIQLRREGAGTWLIDPIAFDDLAPLQEALEGTEWILHAATQDLPCLAEVGLRPTRCSTPSSPDGCSGYPRVGLATLVETLLGSGWPRSTRPSTGRPGRCPSPGWSTPPSTSRCSSSCATCSPPSWSRPARPTGPARSSSTWLVRASRPGSRPWRRTSGLHRVRGRRALAAVRALWETRDEIAPQRDVTPAGSSPTPRSSRPRWRCRPTGPRCSATKGFHGRGAERYASRWVAALQEAPAMPEADLPTRAPRGDGPPLPAPWAEKDPVAARRLQLGPRGDDRAGRGARRAGREPAHPRLPAPRAVGTADDPRARRAARRGRRAAGGYGARSWQVGLTSPCSPTRSSMPRPPTPEPAARRRQDGRRRARRPGLRLLGRRRSRATGSGRQDRPRRLVDLLGERVEVEDRDGENIPQARGDRPSSSAYESSSGGDASPARCC